jgi:hypothetical protein
MSHLVSRVGSSQASNVPDVGVKGAGNVVKKPWQARSCRRVACATGEESDGWCGVFFFGWLTLPTQQSVVTIVHTTRHTLQSIFL